MKVFELPCSKHPITHLYPALSLRLTSRSSSSRLLWQPATFRAHFGDGVSFTCFGRSRRKGKGSSPDKFVITMRRGRLLHDVRRRGRTTRLPEVFLGDVQSLGYEAPDHCSNSSAGVPSPPSFSPRSASFLT
eukprot:765640-Hanusia_phi.AAC.4